MFLASLCILSEILLSAVMDFTLKINRSSLASIQPLCVAVCADRAEALCVVSSKNEGF